MTNTNSISSKISIHPNFAALQVSLEAFKRACADQFSSTQAAENFFNEHADPEKWVPLIVESLGTPQIASLRVQHEQTCIVHLCHVLSAEESQRRALDAHAKFLNSLTNLFARSIESDFVEDLNSPQAVDLSTCTLSPQDRVIDLKMDFAARRLSCCVLERVFRSLVREVVAVENLSKYPENPISDPLNRLHQLTLFPIRHQDWDKDSQARGDRLIDLLDEVQVSLQVAREQVLRLRIECQRTENTELNQSLLEVLHGNKDVYGRTPEQIIATRQSQILQQEAVRQLARMALSCMVATHEALLTVLKETVIEVQSRADEMTSQRRLMAHPECRMIPIMMINCLSADRFLRDFAQEFQHLSAICEQHQPGEHEMQNISQLLHSLNERLTQVQQQHRKP